MLSLSRSTASLPSRMNISTKRASFANCGRMHLMARSRSACVPVRCLARYTSAIPPRAISPNKRYLPKAVGSAAEPGALVERRGAPVSAAVDVHLARPARLGGDGAEDAGALGFLAHGVGDGAVGADPQVVGQNLPLLRFVADLSVDRAQQAIGAGQIRIQEQRRLKLADGGLEVLALR